MNHDPGHGEPEQVELEITDLVSELLEAEPSELDRTLAQALVAHGLVPAASVWRPDGAGLWTVRCSSGVVDELPHASTVRAILTHGWAHELEFGGAVLQEGDVALAIGALPEDAVDLLDQIHALLTILGALGDDLEDEGASSLLSA